MPSTYEPIATNTLGSATATVTFSSIPSTYTDLILVAVFGNSANSNKDIQWTFNGDTTTNYSNTFLYGTGTAAASARDSNANFNRISGSSNNTPIHPIVLQINNYANATTFKTSICRNAASAWNTTASVGLWRKTPEAINSISLTNETSANFVIGSTFTLYGIKAA
jgi:hypothetical protein